MRDLREYVEMLFRHQRLTPEVKDLKEEILSNMIAKRDDLIAQGMDEETATAKAEDSLSAVDSLIDGNQMTDVGKYRLECTQAALLNSILFWIFSLPLLFYRISGVFLFGAFDYGRIRRIVPLAKKAAAAFSRFSFANSKSKAQKNRLDHLGTVLFCQCRNRFGNHFWK